MHTNCMIGCYNISNGSPVIYISVVKCLYHMPTKGCVMLALQQYCK